MLTKKYDKPIMFMMVALRADCLRGYCCLALGCDPDVFG
ncbi:hypothetical protein SAMN05216604_12019 [Pseudomonas agarici]|nr:hypothetical protein SAMN05216604_12019 [Pseudomonas agarici]